MAVGCWVKQVLDELFHFTTVKVVPVDDEKKMPSEDDKTAGLRPDRSIHIIYIN